MVSLLVSMSQKWYTTSENDPFTSGWAEISEKPQTNLTPFIYGVVLYGCHVIHLVYVANKCTEWCCYLPWTIFWRSWMALVARQSKRQVTVMESIIALHRLTYRCESTCSVHEWTHAHISMKTHLNAYMYTRDVINTPRAENQHTQTFYSLFS